MSLKEIIKAKQGSRAIGQMYRIAEIADKQRRQNEKRRLLVWGIY